MNKDLLEYITTHTNKLVKYVAGLLAPSILLIYVSNKNIFISTDIFKILILSISISSSTYIVCCIFECYDILIKMKKAGVKSSQRIVSMLLGQVEIDVEPQSADSAMKVLKEIKQTVGEISLLYNFFVLSIAVLVKIIMPNLTHLQIVLLVISELILMLIFKWSSLKITKLKDLPPLEIELTKQQ